MSIFLDRNKQKGILHNFLHQIKKKLLSAQINFQNFYMIKSKVPEIFNITLYIFKTECFFSLPGADR